MKTILGIVLIIVGLIVGIYVGVYLMFIKGIIRVVNGIAPIMIGSEIAWGIVKIMFAGCIGAISALLFMLPGKAMLD